MYKLNIILLSVRQSAESPQLCLVARGCGSLQLCWLAAIAIMAGSSVSSGYLMVAAMSLSSTLLQQRSSSPASGFQPGINSALLIAAELSRHTLTGLP
jgi:hypothetical protein